MKELLFNLARDVLGQIEANFDLVKAKKRTGLSYGGDTQFNIDEIAEEAVYEFLEKNDPSIAYYSEDKGLIKLSENPKHLLIIDPIDGTRSAAAGLESCCFSVAMSAYNKDACINDVQYALLHELKTKKYFYADHSGNFESSDQINLSKNEDISNMFWSMEFNGHPAKLMTHCLGKLIDSSANPGGIFIFNSASYSISRIFNGQLDSYVDIGNRLLKDCPELEKHFRAVGNDKILHLFPYDIAAAVFIAKKIGITITDGYGNDLGTTKLLDIEKENLQSCIAASNEKLHTKLLNEINWIDNYNEIKNII